MTLWGCVCVCVCVRAHACVCVSQSVMPDSLRPMDCRLLGSSSHGILQTRIVESGPMPSSRGYSWSRDRTHVSWTSCPTGRFFTIEPPGKSSEDIAVNRTPKSLPSETFHSNEKRPGDLAPGTSCSLWRGCSYYYFCQVPLILQAPSLEVTRLTHEGYDGGLDQVVKMWEEVEHILRVESIWFTDGLDTEYKEESRCLPDVGQSNEKDEVPNSWEE